VDIGTLEAALARLQVHVHVAQTASTSSSSGPGLSVPAGQREAETSGSALSRTVDYRFYVVWRVPGFDYFHGVVEGEHPRPWRFIAQLLPGGLYAGSGAALRRCYSRQEAEALYISSAPRYDGLPARPVLHIVQ